METGTASPNLNSTSDPTYTAAAEVIAAINEADATLLQTREVLNNGEQVLGHARAFGDIALRAENLMSEQATLLTTVNSDRTANPAAHTNQPERSSNTGQEFMERAGESLTNLYTTLLDAAKAVPWADHYSKNAWFEHSDPDNYHGPGRPDDSLIARKAEGAPMSAKEKADLLVYGAQATAYDHNIRQHAGRYPYIDIDGWAKVGSKPGKDPNQDPETQPVVEFLAAHGIDYESAWRLGNKQHKLNSRNQNMLYSLDADVVHKFRDQNNNLDIKIAYGSFRDGEYARVDRTPVVTVSDGQSEKRMGEESWDEVPGLRLLLGIIEPGKRFEVKVPGTAANRLKYQWSTAFNSINHYLRDDFDTEVTKKEFLKLQDKMTYNMNHSRSTFGWTPDALIHHKNYSESDVPEPVPVSAPLPGGKALNPDDMPDEIAKAARRQEDEEDNA